MGSYIAPVPYRADQNIMRGFEGMNAGLQRGIMALGAQKQEQRVWDRNQAEEEREYERDKAVRDKKDNDFLKGVDLAIRNDPTGTLSNIFGDKSPFELGTDGVNALLKSNAASMNQQGREQQLQFDMAKLNEFNHMSPMRIAAAHEDLAYKQKYQPMALEGQQLSNEGQRAKNQQIAADVEAGPWTPEVVPLDGGGSALKTSRNSAVTWTKPAGGNDLEYTKGPDGQNFYRSGGRPWAPVPQGGRSGSSRANAMEKNPYTLKAFLEKQADLQQQIAEDEEKIAAGDNYVGIWPNTSRAERLKKNRAALKVHEETMAAYKFYHFGWIWGVKAHLLPRFLCKHNCWALALKAHSRHCVIQWRIFRAEHNIFFYPPGLEIVLCQV